jgi:hypothetical protein
MARKQRKIRDVLLPPWTPFEPAIVAEDAIRAHQQACGLSDEEIASMVKCEHWRNSRYQVQLRRLTSHTPESPPLVWLSIKRNDQLPIRDWRELQRIKNELVGPDYEGIELYPAEQRRVDTSNQYHLWVIDDPRFRFGFGFHDRLVLEDPPGTARQRPFEPDWPQ